MSTKTEPAVFFGSGPVAAKCLELLLKHTEVETVITKPLPPHHRGTAPVIDVAKKHNLPIVTAGNKTELDDIMQTHTFASRYAILIDFGIIVSQKVIDSFPLGIINSHFSLLPHLRGADPITWAIANGDEKTGVSLMLVDKGMDTGKLLTQKTHHLTGSETAPELTEALIILSDQLIHEYVPRYLSGALKPHQQPHPDRATYSRKLTKQDGIIDWQQPAQTIEQKIRAFAEWPQSRTKIGNTEIIITHAKIVTMTGAPGDFVIQNNQLIIFAAKNALQVETLKPIGKKEMPVKAFLAGYSSALKH